MPEKSSKAFQESKAECIRVYTSLQDAAKHDKLQMRNDLDKEQIKEQIELEIWKAFTKEEVERAVKFVQESEVAGKTTKAG